MELVNETNEHLKKQGSTNKGKDWVMGSICFKIILLLAPFVPHFSEELWQTLAGKKTSIFQEPWPDFDSNYLQEDIIEIPVQVNGKLRGVISTQLTANEEQIFELAMKNDNIIKHLKNKKIKKKIYIEKKLLNFVVI